MTYNSRRGSCESIGEKGIVSDRCELNRQIKADNALLRELKAQMKKMAQAAKNSLPAIAEAMETLRANIHSQNLPLTNLFSKADVRGVCPLEWAA